MTREEAIRIFKKEIECMSHTKCSDCRLEKVCDPISTTPLDSEYIVAFSMAIEALSAEPCEDATLKDIFCMGCEYKEQEPCEDAISRAAAIKAMDDLEQEDIERYSCSIPEGFDGKRAIEALQKLPSATPKQKSGHWMLQPSNKDQGERDFIWWKCSECGQVIFSDSERDRREFHAFCSRCGTRMEESED